MQKAMKPSSCLRIYAPNPQSRGDPRKSLPYCQGGSCVPRPPHTSAWPSGGPYGNGNATSACDGTASNSYEQNFECESRDAPLWGCDEKKVYYDGGYPEREPYHTMYPATHQGFFSEQNMQYLRHEIKKRGNFNALVSADILRNMMNDIYSNNLPYSAYDRTDPKRCAYINSGRDVHNTYIREFVAKINELTINDAVANAKRNAFWQKKHLYDLSGFRGVCDVPLPMYTNYGTNRCGSILNLSEHLLPQDCRENNN